MARPLSQELQPNWEKIKSPFTIKFNYITAKKLLQEWMFTSGGKIKHTDCYPVKITIYSHTCSPGVESQRYAMKQSGSSTLDIEVLQDMINLLHDAGGTLENRLPSALMCGDINLDVWRHQPWCVETSTLVCGDISLDVWRHQPWCVETSALLCGDISLVVWRHQPWCVET